MLAGGAEPDEGSAEGGFPTAALAHDAESLAGRDAQGDTGDGVDVPLLLPGPSAAGGKANGEVGGFDEGLVLWRDAHSSNSFTKPSSGCGV